MLKSLILMMDSENLVVTACAYTPEKCQIAINHLKQGKSVHTMAHHLGVAPSTMYKWMTDIPSLLMQLSVAKLWVMNFGKMKV